MALNAYLKLVGQRQGQIRGSVTEKGREGLIMVAAVDHELISPRDPTSGLPQGKLMHKPVTITKPLDRSSPLLYTAMSGDENITEWQLQFFRTSSTGTQVNHYTIRLTNSNIARIEYHMPNNRTPELANQSEFEVVSFTYQAIEWTWIEGGITSRAEWESPLA